MPSKSLTPNSLRNKGVCDRLCHVGEVKRGSKRRTGHNQWVFPRIGEVCTKRKNNKRLNVLSMSNSSSAFFYYRKLTWMEQQLWWGEGRAETGSSGQPLSNFPQSRRLCSWTKVPLWAKPHHDTEQMYLHPAEERRRKRNLIPKSDMNINHLLTLVRDWWVWLRKSLSHSTTLARKKQFCLWAAWSVDGSLEG